MGRKIEISINTVTHAKCTLSNSLGYRHLRSLPKGTVFNWNLRSVIAIWVNIQSLYPKLDTIIHHMQIVNNEMAFIIETQINKKRGPTTNYLTTKVFWL